VTLKMAVLAPTPGAMARAAVSANTGLFRSVRPANLPLAACILLVFVFFDRNKCTPVVTRDGYASIAPRAASKNHREILAVSIRR